MMVVFWTSAPLCAVLKALTGPDQILQRASPVSIAWVLVVVSSAFLSLDAFPMAPDEAEKRRRIGRAPEAIVYPLTFVLSLFFFWWIYP